MNADFHDALEARDPAEREATLVAALPALVAHAQRNASAFAQLLAGVDAATINSRAALATLPVVRKPELLERQQAARDQGGDPFGGFATIGWRALGSVRRAQRVFQSPGPIYEPEGPASDYWRLARALYAAGLRAGDLVHNSFSATTSRPAGLMMESGALALGCTVFPGGVGNTELQLQAIGRAAARRLHRHAELPEDPGREGRRDRHRHRLAEEGAARRRGLPAVAARLAASSAASQAYQSYATADLGLIAYETAAREGLVIDEGVIVEIVRPGSGEPVADGEVGEVVVTTLNADYPLIRFGTGDLSAVLPGRCPTGRTNTRIRAGSAAPTRRPRCAACSCMPARSPKSSSATPRSPARGWWSKARWPTTA